MSISALSLPSKFALVHYRFILEALEPLHLPPYKGSALRGGFGHTFKRLVCTHPLLCNDACQLKNDCPYGYVFETSPPAEAEIFSRNQDVQRPFIIEPPCDRRELILPGERLNFGLTLVGYSMNLFPYFLAVFRELGWAGLGKTRGKYELLAIDAISPYEGQVEDVYRADQQQIRITNLTLNSEAITTHAADLPADRVTLEFLTPTRLKHKGRFLFEGPPFEAVVRTLLGRTSSLSYFHCGQRFETDFRGLIDRAAAIEIKACQTRWEDWERVSGRHRQRIKMGGLVGRVTYEGDIEPYLPLLALGELIHVGKGTVFGNGHYRIEK